MGHSAENGLPVDDGTYMLDHHGRIVDPFADALDRAEETRCECRCHANPAVKHFAPCCHPETRPIPPEVGD